MTETTQLPHFVETREDEGETKYGINLTAMGDGDEITVTVKGDPTAWPVFPSKYSGSSVLAIFQTELPDVGETDITAFVASNRLSPGPKGTTLLGELQKREDGDTVKIRLQLKETNAGRTCKLFHVEDFQ